jgi:hypothetical protein
MATSIETPAGSWAVVPMGTLDDPLNTFWQLFFRPSGASGWSDEASSLAVATNGGLAVATFGRGSLAVAIRPANRLDYSPLLVTADSGRAWSPVPPLGGVAKMPDALAVGASGRGLALTTGTTGNDVLESASGLADWKELTSTGTLQSSAAGRRSPLSVSSRRTPSLEGTADERAWPVSSLRLPMGGVSSGRHSRLHSAMQRSTYSPCSRLEMGFAPSSSPPATRGRAL